MATDYDPRRLVRLGAERITNVSSTDFPGHYPDEDHAWDVQKQKEVGLFSFRGERMF